MEMFKRWQIIYFFLLLISSFEDYGAWTAFFWLPVFFFITIMLSGSSLYLVPRRSKEESMELVKAETMDEDDVLENFGEDEVVEEDGLNTIEIE